MNMDHIILLRVILQTSCCLLHGVFLICYFTTLKKRSLFNAVSLSQILCISQSTHTHTSVPTFSSFVSLWSLFDHKDSCSSPLHSHPPRVRSHFSSRGAANPHVYRSRTNLVGSNEHERTRVSARVKKFVARFDVRVPRSSRRLPAVSFMPRVIFSESALLVAGSGNWMGSFLRIKQSDRYKITRVKYTLF